MKKPFLSGEHIYLRTIVKSDLTPAYRDWFNDEEVCRFNSHHRFPQYDGNMRDYYDRVIKSRENLVLAICDKKTDAHIGNISLLNIDLLNQSAELGIIIGDKKQWGKGVGRKASKLLLAHGFNQLNLHRIYCGTNEDNVPMQKLASSLGFIEEGRARHAMFKDGIFKNVIYYSLLRDDLKKSKKAQ